MRMLLTVQLDTAKANKAITDKTLPKVMKSVHDRIKPEAAFFTAVDGMRTHFLVFDLKEPSDMPSIAEPFFQELEAKVTFSPAMNLDDLQAGLQKLESS
ncbi:hypothetical protein [Kitasatospora azatica]|uniref:hypothetical protein n=1 Tax=Kitasatospora azatica TaxID=58347 RepID=UPI00055E8266|nr:hypothetical protein [Kitasatospora azatica]